MMDRAVVSAPGKLILMGEHAAVYGRPALVAAVGPRVEVELRRSSGPVILDLPDFGARIDTGWREILAFTAAARRAWEDYARQPSPERFAAIGSGSAADVVTAALGETARALALTDPPAVLLRVKSSLPVGSGFGSSAATAVAVVGALHALLGIEAGHERLDELALEVERRQHGLPSGIDHQTVLRGGVVWAEHAGKRGFRVVPLEVRSPILSRLQVFQTGRPSETTGEVVAEVRRRWEPRSEALEALLDRMQRGVERLREQLLARRPDASRVSELIRDYEGCLEELGVVPSRVRETIRRLEAAGGAGKISGAGALTGHAAGCLLTYWPGAIPEHLPPGLVELQQQPVELGAPGLRVEVVE